MRILIISVFLILNATLEAQTGKVLDARNSVATNDIKNAKILIDQAEADPANLNDPYLWYWKGYIYNELYKDQAKGINLESNVREEAVAAFEKLLKMRDRVSSEDTLTLASALKKLSYLAATYYNNAVISLDTVMYATAIENFDQFRRISILVDPSNDLTDKDVKFRLKLATIYVSLYEVRSSHNSGDLFFEMARKEYAGIIEMDKNNLTANYNLGIHFYNKAVNIIKNLDVGTSLEELAKQEDVCVELFLRALPYVKAAYELDPLRKETLIGLTGIYWSLNDQEKYQFYQEKLKELE